MADLLIAGTGGPGRYVATMAEASGRWSSIAFLTMHERAGGSVKGSGNGRAARGGRSGANGTRARGNGSADSGIGTYVLMPGAVRLVDEEPDEEPGAPHGDSGAGDDADEPHTVVEERCGDWRIVGCVRSARELTDGFSDVFVAEQANGPRADTLRRMAHYGFFLPCLVHPTAFVCKSARMDYGCLVGPQAVVETGAQLGMGNIVGPGASVGFDCAFGLAVHMGAGAHLGANARIGGYTRIGIGAIVAEGVTIGQNVTVAAGAVVTHDIPDGVTVSGSPAAILPMGCSVTPGEIRIRL